MDSILDEMRRANANKKPSGLEIPVVGVFSIGGIVAQRKPENRGIYTSHKREDWAITPVELHKKSE